MLVVSWATQGQEVPRSVARKIDNLVEIARTFGKMVTVRKMKQIVPELMLTEISGRINSGVGLRLI
jgi:hypothetical protein